MDINKQMNWAVLDVKHYFMAENIVLNTENINLQYMAAKMMFRKIISIFPELDTREPHSEVEVKVSAPRLIKKLS